MYIQKIKIQNFKSIYEPLELDFKDMKGLWKISGSVGSGKTTIGEAIIFGLFGSISGKNNGDLVSWGQKHGLVEIWCVAKGRSIYIKRELNTYGQSPIYVEVDGDELVFTNKRNAQQQLETEYYDITRVTLELLCIISFNNFKSLATLNTRDTKQFLDQVLGFYTLTEYAEACKQLKSDNQKEMMEIRNNISNLQAQIDKVQQISNTERIEGDIDKVKETIKNIQGDRNKITEDIKPIYQKLNDEMQDIQNEITKTLTLGKNIKKEIDFIEKGICPTCGAPIDQSKLQEKKDERECLINAYKRLVKDQEAKTKELNDIRLDTNDKINKLILEENESSHFLMRLEEQKNRLSINTKEIENLEKEVAKQTKVLDKGQQEDAEWNMLYDVLSVTVRSKILESFIPALNKNILKYSQRLRLPYIISFDSSFICNIQLCGSNQVISQSSLSTGQLKTVDMVIILGVLGTVLGASSCSVMFLDELFSNMDVNLRNEMCSVLREFLKEDQTIFVISHTDMDNKYFDGDMHMKLELQNQFEKHTVVEKTKRKWLEVEKMNNN